MAESLALDQRQAPAPVDTGRPAPITGGTIGEVSNPDLSISPVLERSGARLLDGLIKVAGDLIKPVVKQQDEAAFFDGMARAAAGEAAKDIAAENPPWANFFGEGAGVLGARAYEGARDSARIETEALESLSRDRALPPEDYAQVLRQRLGAMKTGDPIRDGQMQAASLQMLPSLLKAHAQAHVKYNQEQAFKARSETFTAAIDALEAWNNHARELGAPLTAEDKARAKATFESALAPIPGEDLQVRDRVIVASLLSAMTEGKFAAVEHLKDIGAFEALPIEQRDQLNRTYRIESARAVVGRAAPEVLDRATSLYLNPPRDGELLDQQINAINSDAARTSGVYGSNLIGEDERLKLRERAGLQAAKSAAARMKAEDKEAAEAALQAGARAALLDPRGIYASASLWANVRGEGASRALDQQGTILWQEALKDPQKAPQARASLLVNLGAKNALAAAVTEFGTAANAADWNPQVGMAWQTLKQLPPEVMGAYVNNDQEYVFRQAELYQQGGVHPQEAWKHAKADLATRPFRDPDLNKAEREAAEAVVKEFNTSPWFRDRTDAQGLTLLQGMVGAGMRTAPGGAPEARALAARGQVTAKGGELIGNVFFFRSQPGLENWRSTLQGGNGAGEDQVAEAFHLAWERKLKLNSGLNDQVTWPMGKLKPTLPWIVMAKDARGDFYFSSVYNDPDADGLIGKQHSVTITKRDIEAELKKAGELIDAKRRHAATAGTSGSQEPLYIAP